jgi:hypothetical protein
MPTLSGEALASWRATGDDAVCWAPATSGTPRTAMKATTGNLHRREDSCKFDLMAFPPTNVFPCADFHAMSQALPNSRGEEIIPDRRTGRRQFEFRHLA